MKAYNEVALPEESIDKEGLKHLKHKNHVFRVMALRIKNLIETTNCIEYGQTQKIK